MAAPAVLGRATCYGTEYDNYSTITLPGSIGAGERLLVIFNHRAPPLNQGHGIDQKYSGKKWERLCKGVAYRGNGSDISIFTKVAEGGGNDKLRLYIDNNIYADHSSWSAVAFRIEAANCVEVSDLAAFTLAEEVDPPSLSPSFGGTTPEALWITTCCMCSGHYATSAPTNYSNLTVVSAVDNTIGTAERVTTTATEDPGYWTVTRDFTGAPYNEWWIDAAGTQTIAVYNETEDAVVRVGQLALEVLNTPPETEGNLVVGQVVLEILTSNLPPVPPPEDFWQWNGYFHDFMVILGSYHTDSFTPPADDEPVPNPDDCVPVGEVACDAPIIWCSVLPVTFSVEDEVHYAFPVTPTAQTFLIQSINVHASIGGIDGTGVEHGRIISFMLMDAAPSLTLLNSSGTAAAEDRLYLGQDIQLTAGDSVILQYINMTLADATVINGWFLKAASDVAPIPYDLGGSLSGAPLASAVILRYPFPRRVDFPSGLTGSQGIAATAATAQTDFDIQKDGSSVGTMRFAMSGTTATFIMASPTTFMAGDVLTIVAPASPDATLANIGFALVGTRY